MAVPEQISDGRRQEPVITYKEAIIMVKTIGSKRVSVTCAINGGVLATAEMPCDLYERISLFAKNFEDTDFHDFARKAALVALDRNARFDEKFLEKYLMERNQELIKKRPGLI